MDKKIAVIAIIVSNAESVEKVNLLLHSFRGDIIGRFGLPVKDKNISVISIVMESTPENINSLSGKLGMISGVSSKVVQTK